MSDIITQVKEKISEGETGKAIEVLVKNSTRAYDKEIALLSMQYNHYIKNQLRGILSFEEKQLIINKISYSTIELAEKLEANVKSSDTENRSLIFRAGFMLLICTLTVFLFYYLQRGFDIAKVQDENSTAHDSITKAVPVLSDTSSTKPGRKAVKTPVYNNREDQKTFLLSVFSEPDHASIYIDGKFSGMTDRGLFLKSGQFKITIKKDGYHEINDIITVPDQSIFSIILHTQE